MPKYSIISSKSMDKYRRKTTISKPRGKNFRYYFNMIKARLLWRYWIIRSLFTPCDCGYACDWVYPYGFVPEADCPVHDC